MFPVLHIPLLLLPTLTTGTLFMLLGQAAAVTNGTWAAKSHADWTFTHTPTSFTLQSPCFASTHDPPSSVSRTSWTAVFFSLVQKPPLMTGISWSASLNCSSVEESGLVCLLRCGRVTASGGNMTWELSSVAFARAAPSSSSSPAVCSALDTGSYTYADPPRHIVFRASAGASRVNLSCSTVTQTVPVAVSDGWLVFIPLQITPTAASPLPKGIAVLAGRWSPNRTSLTASLFFAADANDVPVPMQSSMAGLPLIWSSSAAVVLSAAALSSLPAAECSSPQPGVWGGVHWQLNLTHGGGGELLGDCCRLSVSAAVLVTTAESRLLVVAATGYNLATSPPSLLGVRAFAIAGDGGGGAAASGSSSVLKGVVLAAALGGSSTAVVAEEFLLRHKSLRSYSDKWTFPCLDLTSSGARAAVAPLALATLVLWCVGAVSV